MILATLALLTATPANINTLIASSQPGDVIRLPAGPFPPLTIKGVSKAQPGVTIDASQAQPHEIGIFGASGFTLVGGVYHACGYTCVLIQQGSSNITVKDAVFFDAKAAGVGISTSTHITVTGNAFRNPSDGVDITSSQFVDVERNNCLVATPANIHADCVQAWNNPPTNVDSDLTIAYNMAIGYEQGFDNAGTAGGAATARASVHDNGYAGTMQMAGGFGNCKPGCSMVNNAAFYINGAAHGTTPNFGMTGDSTVVISGNIAAPKAP